MGATKKVLDLNNIVIKKGFNPRMFFHDEPMESTKKNILERGLLYPVTVQKIELTKDNINQYEIYEGGEKHEVPENYLKKEEIYVLRDGERRYRCHQHLISEGHNVKGICVTFEKATTKEDDVLAIAYLKNTSEPLTPIEEAYLFNRFLNVYNWSIEDVAKMTGKTSATIKNRLYLLDSSKEVQKALNEKEIGVTAATDIIRESGGSIPKQNEKLKEIKITGKNVIAKEKKTKREEKQKAKLREEIFNPIDPFDAGEDSNSTVEDDDIAPITIQKVDKDEITVNSKHLIKEFHQHIQACKENYEDGNEYKAVYYYARCCQIAEIIPALDVYENLEEEILDAIEQLI